jgi:hypothetical protein
MSISEERSEHNSHHINTSKARGQWADPRAHEEGVSMEDTLWSLVVEKVDDLSSYQLFEALYNNNFPTHEMMF